MIVQIETDEGPLAVIEPMIHPLLEQGLVTESATGYITDSKAAVLAWIHAHGICDFCSAPNPRHTIMVPDFDMPIGRSTGGFAVCDVCHEMLRENRRADLLRRTLDEMPGARAAVASTRKLHQAFWAAYDDMIGAAGAGKAIYDFIEGRLLDYKPAPELKNRERRLEAVRRLAGLAEDEMEALLRGDVAYKNVAKKLAQWRRSFGVSPTADAASWIKMLSDPPPLPPGKIPHWQEALDRRFEAIAGLTRAVKTMDGFTAYFNEATDLKDPTAVTEKLRAAEQYKMFRDLDYEEDVKHLSRADAYSFNAETMEAIRQGAESIPHESMLSSVNIPQTSAGWFWFAEPFPVTSSPIASNVTHALLWGWDTSEKAGNIVRSMAKLRASGVEPADNVPTLHESDAVLRFAAYVIDKDGKCMPSTKWTWPLNATFHEMLAFNHASHEALYGPGGKFHALPHLVGTELTLKAIAELSLFFLMACVWFKQEILVAAPGHIERHARKRYVREHKLKETPTVRVIALRKSAHGGGEPREGGERHYHVSWIVAGHPRLQPVGPGRAERKLIWIDAYRKGPEDAPLKPKTTKVYAVVR